jgi:hypothetical protein
LLREQKGYDRTSVRAKIPNYRYKCLASYNSGSVPTKINSMMNDTPHNTQRGESQKGDKNYTSLFKASHRWHHNPLEGNNLSFSSSSR